MALFPFNKKREFFTKEQQQLMVKTIQEAEKNTSGEVRFFVESKCKYVDPVDRAKEIFLSLKMEQTRDRNAVLLYMAMDDHQLALFADEGIYQRLGSQYWNDEVKKIIAHFTKDDYTGGVCHVISDIGHALKKEFPYESSDKNELPDEIIFGN
jgi:uncharacterized membrane protein